MKWKFCVETVQFTASGLHDSIKKFNNYNEAVDYAFHCEDDSNFVYVAILIITKGDLSYE